MYIEEMWKEEGKRWIQVTKETNKGNINYYVLSFCFCFYLSLSPSRSLYLSGVLFLFHDHELRIFFLSRIYL